jgi:hypothetical protein
MSRTKSCLLVAVSVLLLLIISCTSNKNEVKTHGPVFFDYRVWGDEESGDMTVKIQYRDGALNGHPLLLKEPSRVEFDGQTLQADSSGMNGIYYETSRRVTEFAGNHTIVFTDSSGEQYREEFSFRPISLKTELPTRVVRDSIVLELGGLSQQDYIRLIMTDTAAFSEGIVRVDTIRNGRLNILKNQLGRLSSGPVFLEIAREMERRINDEKGLRRGKLSVFYSLKREFELVD